MENLVKFIFLFLIGTTLLNFTIAVGARLNTKDSKFDILIFYWLSLFLTFGGAAALSASETQIGFAYFFQVVSTFIAAKLLYDSRQIEYRLKLYGSFWVMTALLSSLLLIEGSSGFTLSLIPVTIGTTIILIEPAWNSLVTQRKTSNWIEKGIALLFISGLINHFNYAFFRLDPSAQWWGWALSIAQYQCISVFLPLLLNHQRAKNERMQLEHALRKISGNHTHLDSGIDVLYKKLEFQIVQKEELTRSLQRANSSLEEERETNEILIKTISHDLANPLTVINAYTGMLVAERVRESERPVILRRMQTNVNSALEMISRIRKAIVTRNHASLVTVENVGLDRAIERVIESFQTQLEAKKLELVYENRTYPPSFVFAEENSLTEHIFANVLTNSIKFSYENSRIFITAVEEEDFIRVDFKDLGQGIDSDRLSRKIFHSTTGTSGEVGTGFGFMVMSYFLRKFEGKYQIHSEGLDKGTTVSVYLRKSSPGESVLSPAREVVTSLTH